MLDAVQADLNSLVTESQSDRVVIERNGRPSAVVVGIEDDDDEDLALASSDEFWPMISERRHPGRSSPLSEGREGLRSIRWLLEMIEGMPGILRVILNGSFVTDVPEPNDVDCAILVDERFDSEGPIADLLDDGWPFLYPEVVHETNFSYLVNRFFATDRASVPKGMIEVMR